MTKIVLLALLITLFLPIAALANDPRCDFMSQEATKGIVIQGISGTNPQDPTWQIQYDPSMTTAQISQGNTDVSSFDWTYYPNPDVTSFKTQIVTDFAAGALPASAYLNLCQFSSTVADLAFTPPALQASWQALIATEAQPASGNTPAGPLYGNYPNTAPYNGNSIIAQIESYAAQYNVPLSTESLKKIRAKVKSQNLKN